MLGMFELFLFVPTLFVHWWTTRKGNLW
jgi:hypothetical protein